MAENSRNLEFFPFLQEPATGGGGRVIPYPAEYFV
jgi:hypothetical protein